LPRPRLCVRIGTRLLTLAAGLSHKLAIDLLGHGHPPQWLDTCGEARGEARSIWIPITPATRPMSAS